MSIVEVAAQPHSSCITGRQWLVLLLVQVATLTFGMTITATNVVLPQIRGALSATQDQVAWVVTLYLVAAAVATPLTGWLSGRLGWRRFMTGTLIGFTVASFLCGLAGSLETLLGRGERGRSRKLLLPAFYSDEEAPAQRSLVTVVRQVC